MGSQSMAGRPGNPNQQRKPVPQPEQGQQEGQRQLPLCGGHTMGGSGDGSVDFYARVDAVDFCSRIVTETRHPFPPTLAVRVRCLGCRMERWAAAWPPCGKRPRTCEQLFPQAPNGRRRGVRAGSWALSSTRRQLSPALEHIETGYMCAHADERWDASPPQPRIDQSTGIVGHPQQLPGQQTRGCLNGTRQRSRRAARAAQRRDKTRVRTPLPPR